MNIRKLCKNSDDLRLVYLQNGEQNIPHGSPDHMVMVVVERNALLQQGKVFVLVVNEQLNRKVN